MDKFDFICFSLNNWEKRKARKQQFMLYLSKRNDVDKVLYIEPPVNIFRLIIFPFSELGDLENRARWKRAVSYKTEAISEKLFVFTPLFYIPFSFRYRFIYNINLFISILFFKSIVRKMDFKNIVLWIYHPFDYLLLKWFKNRAISVFDWAENWAEYFREFSEYRRKKISGLENKIIKGSDVVFTVSKSLLQRAVALNRNSYRLYDGVSAELFISPQKYIPEDIKNIKKPIIGYAGTIMERFNTGLVSRISDKFLNASIVLIGNVNKRRVNVVELEKRKNIHFLGGKDYSELPAYMDNFDICIMPYKINTFTSPPTKIFDYLAAGKPIVSVPFPEYEKFNDCVYFADTDLKFIEYVRKCLDNDPEELKNLRKKIAGENSWKIRVEEIVQILKKQRKD